MKTTGLSLAEAYASGRKYRRAGQQKYYRHDGQDPVKLEWAIATDFELEPEAKLLTRKDVEYALYGVNWGQGCAHIVRAACDELFGEEGEG